MLNKSNGYQSILDLIRDTISIEVEKTALMADIPWERAVSVDYGPNSIQTQTYSRLVCVEGIVFGFSISRQSVADLEEYIVKHPNECGDTPPLVFRFVLHSDGRFEHFFGYSSDDEAQALRELDAFDANHRSRRKKDYKRVRDQSKKS